MCSFAVAVVSASAALPMGAAAFNLASSRFFRMKYAAIAKMSAAAHPTPIATPPTASLSLPRSMKAFAKGECSSPTAPGRTASVDVKFALPGGGNIILAEIKRRGRSIPSVPTSLDVRRLRTTCLFESPPTAALPIPTMTAPMPDACARCAI